MSKQGLLFKIQVVEKHVPLNTDKKLQLCLIEMQIFILITDKW